MTAKKGGEKIWYIQEDLKHQHIQELQQQIILQIVEHENQREEEKVTVQHNVSAGHELTLNLLPEMAQTDEQAYKRLAKHQG